MNGKLVDIEKMNISERRKLLVDLLVTNKITSAMEDSLYKLYKEVVEESRRLKI